MNNNDIANDVVNTTPEIVKEGVGAAMGGDSLTMGGCLMLERAGCDFWMRAKGVASARDVMIVHAFMTRREDLRQAVAEALVEALLEEIEACSPQVVYSSLRLFNGLVEAAFKPLAKGGNEGEGKQ